jgi:hypothetical protein
MMPSPLRSWSSAHAIASSSDEYTQLTNFSCGVIGISAPTFPWAIQESVFSIKFIILPFAAAALGSHC